MDIHTTPASLKCVLANHVYAVEQSVHRLDMEEDCYVLNICPHWRGKSAREHYTHYCDEKERKDIRMTIVNGKNGAV